MQITREGRGGVAGFTVPAGLVVLAAFCGFLSFTTASIWDKRLAGCKAIRRYKSDKTEKKIERGGNVHCTDLVLNRSYRGGGMGGAPPPSSVPTLIPGVIFVGGMIRDIGLPSC